MAALVVMPLWCLAELAGADLAGTVPIVESWGSEAVRSKGQWGNRKPKSIFKKF
jgi:hypothetical protein